MKKGLHIVVAGIIVALVIITTAYAPAQSSAGDAAPAHGRPYDIAINNGRVMDPLTGVDAMANVGIKGGKIAAIVPGHQKLPGKKVINATGLVVAPGFINIHGHGAGTLTGGGECHVRDGETTEITGNCGFSGSVVLPADALETSEIERQSALPKSSMLDLDNFFKNQETEGLFVNLASFVGQNTLRTAVGVPGAFDNATPAQIAAEVELVTQAMEAGALGISYGPMYHPGNTYAEMVACGKEASRLGGTSSIHVRYNWPAPKDTEAVKEALDMAKAADNISIIISHRGGSIIAPTRTGILMEMIAKAREYGQKVATDCMPTSTGSNSIGSAIFAGPLEIIAQMMDLKLSDFRVQRTVVIDGAVFMEALEAFTSFDQFRLVRSKVLAKEIPEPGLLMNIYKPEWTWLYYTAPFTMVESDGFIGIDPATGKYIGNPRGAGTFSRFLGYWVRERGVCDLMTGLAKTSTMAAVWLGLDKKGRVQVGCDADLTLFNPNTIIDKSTFLDPGLPPDGIPFVIVNGVLAVDNGTLTGAQAGKVIRRTWDVPGVLPNLGRVPGFGVEALQ